jgi:hypothetical protein
MVGLHEVHGYSDVLMASTRFGMLTRSTLATDGLGHLIIRLEGFGPAHAHVPILSGIVSRSQPSSVMTNRAEVPTGIRVPF